jgi:hypothetical protein
MNAYAGEIWTILLKTARSTSNPGAPWSSIRFRGFGRWTSGTGFLDRLPAVDRTEERAFLDVGPLGPAGIE